MKRAAVSHPTLKPLTETKATEVMWLYYREHKEKLSREVGKFRTTILAELMRGIPAEGVFSPYARTCA